MPTGYFDAHGLQLHAGDLVTLPGGGGELFQIKSFQYPTDAVIENVVPGGRLGTSTLHCDMLMRAINNPVTPPPWWSPVDGDDSWKKPFPSSIQPCGCHLQFAGSESVLCCEHLIEANGGPAQSEASS